jgi:phage head maturation protease
MPEIDVPFEASAALFKAFIGEDGRTRYVVVKASDDRVDLQKDIISPKVFEKVIADAKGGKILLTESHFTAFGFGKSVDGWTQVEKDGSVGLYLMFMLKSEYPQSGELFEAVMRGNAHYQVSVGGKIKDYMYKSDPKYGVVRIITDAVVNHVAVTWSGMAVNPRTGFVQAILKALYSWEEEMQKSGWLVELRKEKDDDDLRSESPGGETVTVEEDEGTEAMEKPEGSSLSPREGGPDMASPVRKESTTEGSTGVTPKGTLKKMTEILDLLEVERRQMRPTAEDLERQAERSRQYGIAVSPSGFAVKPAIFAGIPDEYFLDPVNYIFPVQSPEDVETYLKLWEQKPLLLKSFYPDFSSLRVVLGRLCQKAKEYNVPLDPFASSVWYVDTETAKEVTGGAINEDLHRQISLALEKMENWDEWISTGQVSLNLLKARDKQAEDELLKRAKKYGYDPAPNAHLTKPTEYAHIPESQFADPVGYNYPIDKEHVLAAIRYFLKPANRNVYDPKAQKIVYERILRAMRKYGHTHRFDPDNPLDWLVSSSLKRWMVGYEKYEDEDTPEKREEMEKRLEREYKEHNRGRKQIRKSTLDIPYANVLYQVLDSGLDALADLFQREELYKYYLSPKGYLTPPDDGYIAEDYGDPVSYLYPMTTAEEVQASVEEFLADRKFYPPHAQLFIYRRLLSKAKELGCLKEFDAENPLDYLIAVEDRTLLAKAPIVPEEKAAELEEALRNEHMEYLKETSSDEAIQVMEVMKAFVARQNPEYLAKVITSTTEGLPSVPWVIGQEIVDGRGTRKPKGLGIPPLTYVCPVAKFPVKKVSYPVTDLSYPIAAVTKKAIDFLADKLQKLGGSLRIQKSDKGEVTIEVVKDERVLRKFVLRPEGEEYVLAQFVTVAPKPMLLQKDDLAHLNLAEAIRSGCRDEGAQCGVIVIGTGYAGVITDDGKYLVPYWVTSDGEIKVEWEYRIPAMETFVPEGRDYEEQILEIIYGALREKASEEWQNWIDDLVETEAEGSADEGKNEEENGEEEK